MANESLSPAEQIQKIAGLLGIAVLRWRQNSESSEILSNSQPERLEFASDPLLSVNTQNDLATGRIECSSQNEHEKSNHGRFTATEDRCSDRRSTQLIDLLIERVEFDRASSTLSIIYQPTAISALVSKGENS